MQAPQAPVRRRSSSTLPAPYLLFLGDVTEAGYAKTAFGLRDWARELCVGEFAMPEAGRSRPGLPRLTPREAARARRALDGHRRRQHRRRAEAELDPEPRRGAGGGPRRRLRHARQARRLARAQGGGRAARPAADRHAPAAGRHPGRHRPQAHRQAPAHGRHRLRARQEVHGARDRARDAPAAASPRISAPPARPGS